MCPLAKLPRNEKLISLRKTEKNMLATCHMPCATQTLLGQQIAVRALCLFYASVCFRFPHHYFFATLALFFSTSALRCLRYVYGQG